MKRSVSRVTGSRWAMAAAIALSAYGQVKLLTRTDDDSTVKRLHREHDQGLVAESDGSQRRPAQVDLSGSGAPVRSLKLQRKPTSELTRVDNEIVVAILDTGLDLTHPEFKDLLWTNPGETGLDSAGRDKATNGVDDDGNGLVDDVHGWNFVANDHDLSDNHGHGTHIAGIIKRESQKVQALMPPKARIKLMVLKYFDPVAKDGVVKGGKALERTTRAIRYATQMQARIINFSGGGVDYSRREFEAIRDAGLHDILFVAAAGNEKSDSDVLKFYPAGYELSNIISVTAVNSQTEVLPTSNYGRRSVHIAAPGQRVLSALPGSRYGFLTGTSQAAAFVSGAAAIVMSQSPTLSTEEVKRSILDSGDEVPSLVAKTITARKLNTVRALTALNIPTLPSEQMVAGTDGPSMPTKVLEGSGHVAGLDEKVTDPVPAPESLANPTRF